LKKARTAARASSAHFKESLELISKYELVDEAPHACVCAPVADRVSVSHDALVQKVGMHAYETFRI